jgi:hypothetical protein
MFCGSLAECSGGCLYAPSGGPGPVWESAEGPLTARWSPSGIRPLDGLQTGRQRALRTVMRTVMVPVMAPSRVRHAAGRSADP